jgi:hypothetical protein
MGYIAVAMTCWLSAIAAERLTSHPMKNQQDTDPPGRPSLADQRYLYWDALNRNSY